jgi:hypothetical protein
MIFIFNPNSCNVSVYVLLKDNGTAMCMILKKDGRRTK